MKYIFLNSLLTGAVCLSMNSLPAQQKASLTIDVSGPSHPVSPVLNGLMTEEINHCYDGGLYGELIQNRAFKDDSVNPVHWAPVGGKIDEIRVDRTQPVPGTALTNSLYLRIHPEGGQRAGVSNEGYWGIPLQGNTTYKLSFYARSSGGAGESLDITIEPTDEDVAYAKTTVTGISGEWKLYTAVIKTDNLFATRKNRLVISSRKPGELWLSQVSLFGSTYNNRPNGNRPDLMEKMKAMQPRFLRFPGGNYLEGNTVKERFDWKTTLGEISQRPGHPGPWSYRSTDGLGLLEFLLWCEDLTMEPVLGLYAGYSFDNQTLSDKDLDYYIQDALDEMEYITGSTATKWGAVRKQNGHAEPFKLNYVEVGNEDGFAKYSERYKKFHEAIRAKYPNVQIIHAGYSFKQMDKPGYQLEGIRPDIIDEHYYLSPADFEKRVHQYDTMDRKGPKIFIGEWAAGHGEITPDLKAALSEAAWLTGIERNSDMVIMQCYAPLFANVNLGAFQWPIDLIGYNALSSYGSPSYYGQVMFAQYQGNKTLSATFSGAGRVYQSVTKDSVSGTVYIKLVNLNGEAVTVDVNTGGPAKHGGTLQAIVLSGNTPEATNSIDNPVQVVPVVSKPGKAAAQFVYTLKPFSITVLKLETIK